MMKRVVILVVMVALIHMPVQAQGQRCGQTLVVNAPGSTVTELVAARAGSTVRVCSFVLSTETASAAQFMSNSVARTGVMFIPTNDSISYGDGAAILIEGSTGFNLQLSVGAVRVSGTLTFWQD